MKSILKDTNNSEKLLNMVSDTVGYVLEIKQTVAERIQ